MQLGANFGQWHARLFGAWSDWYLPTVAVDVIVVTPTPIAGADVVQFNVLLL